MSVAENVSVSIHPLLAELTHCQREAVSHLDGPMLVIAGAGSGKTRVVTRRIAYLVDRGIPAWRILALTFTNKAAREMRERVAALVGTTPSWMGTFHSVCARLLRRDIGILNDGRDERFSILDHGDQEGMVKTILKELHCAGEENRPSAILARISRAKANLVLPGDYQPDSWRDEIVGQVYAEYEARLREMNSVDFDDLLVLAVRLLDQSPETLEKYRTRFSYLLVDEYQDTNRVQYRLLRTLAGPAANLHATGDPDQSIYSWRGADYRNIMDFQHDFPGARVVRLEENYRSGRFILAAANNLIRHNRERLDKELFTSSPGGEKVKLTRLQSDRLEAAWIGENAAKLMAGGAKPGEIAVFYRTNVQSRPIEEFFVNRNIPYQLVGGIRFYERREVKDLLAHLRLRVNPRDFASLRRVAVSRPGIGEKTVKAVATAAKEAGSPVFSFLADPNFPRRFGKGGKVVTFAAWCAKLAAIDIGQADTAVRKILALSGLEEAILAAADKDDLADERIENLYSMASRAEEFVRQRTGGSEKPDEEEAAPPPPIDLEAFLEDVALVADVDGMAEGTSRVTLMTLHSAKGLEFDDVFVAGLEEGVLPHRNAETDTAVEEERRLFYVGLTRARQRVWISHAACRSLYGSIELQTPSRFLSELPQDAVSGDDFGCSLSMSSGSGFVPGMARGEGYDFPDLGDDFDPVPDCQGGSDAFFSDGRNTGGKRRSTMAKPETDDRIRQILNETKSTMSKAAFRAGDLVRHPTFGSGKVLVVDRKKIRVQFFASGTRLFLADTTRLTRE
ncbi:MAG: UvrD-helicase domain-containing protein [Planctomycetota bacterium]|jgi:DNA helicase-2/ATP-dependent DNA helicase PcrA|nr:UvrD-helicase domain-containing protein [Planctomycetota bacterium]